MLRDRGSSPQEGDVLWLIPRETVVDAFRQYLGRGGAVRSIQCNNTFRASVLRERFGRGSLSCMSALPPRFCNGIHSHATLPSARQYANTSFPVYYEPSCGYLAIPRRDYGQTLRLGAHGGNWVTIEVTKFLRRDKLQQVLESLRSAQCRWACGNYAILVLLARLGLRACEVVRWTSMTSIGKAII